MIKKFLKIYKKKLRSNKDNYIPKVDDVVEFVWYDRDLNELTTFGKIIKVLENNPSVVKILGDDCRTYIIAREWIKGEVDTDTKKTDASNLPSSPALEIFANENL